MATTIAVKDETLEMLKHVKAEMEADTFDETIRELILKNKKPKKSMFGALKGLKAEFVREEIDRFN